MFSRDAKQEAASSIGQGLFDDKMPILQPEIITDQQKYTTDKKLKDKWQQKYDNLEEYSAAKEYEKKIKSYKLGNYKYKKKDE